jgi:hypothetical protein
MSFGTPRPSFGDDFLPPVVKSSVWKPSVSRRLPRESAKDVVGTFVGTVCELQLPKDAIAFALPDGLRVALDGTTPDEVRAVLMVGYQENVTIRAFRRIARRVGVSYMEAALGVPCVLERGGVGAPFCFLPWLCLDQRIPITLGRRIGLNKQRAAFELGASSMRIEVEGSPVLSAAFEALGPAESSYDCAAFKGIRDAFALDVVTERASGGFLSIPFSWNWATAIVRDLRGEIEITGLVGHGAHRCSAGPNGAPQFGRAWRIRADWAMAWPSKLS